MGLLSILDFLTKVGLFVMVVLLIYVIWKGKDYFSESIPYDNLNVEAESVECFGNVCNITLKHNVTYVNRVAPTGSMLPVIGGNDYFICVNKTPELGDLIVTPEVLHIVYEIDKEWILTKGINNVVADNYKFPKDKVECVVGVVVR